MALHQEIGSALGYHFPKGSLAAFIDELDANGKLDQKVFKKLLVIALSHIEALEEAPTNHK